MNISVTPKTATAKSTGVDIKLLQGEVRYFQDNVLRRDLGKIHPDLTPWVEALREVVRASYPTTGQLMAVQKGNETLARLRATRSSGLAEPTLKDYDAHKIPELIDAVLNDRPLYKAYGALRKFYIEQYMHIARAEAEMNHFVIGSRLAQPNRAKEIAKKLHSFQERLKSLAPGYAPQNGAQSYSPNIGLIQNELKALNSQGTFPSSNHWLVSANNMNGLEPFNAYLTEEQKTNSEELFKDQLAGIASVRKACSELLNTWTGIARGQGIGI